ncbi:hypothetical protein QIS99_09850 [Streptomyces sp. B-S-A8]|uniref:Sigma-like protein n=1 Tax=Streptomyces solicavernae TaxID=3043614 RepID=A0ABT6RQ47_9ACTN|nr:hypothetical protein [Streptomyces sp. B-S-A8]MDI3386515.1 hypothetical protein [Streptomyces sp. B-S-A8]
MSEEKKNTTVKPLDSHAGSEPVDEITTQDSHAGSEPAGGITTQDSHAGSEPA